MTNYAQIAAAVYQACNHYDPWLPGLSEDLARAWGRQFEGTGLSAQSLLLGVDRVYRDNGSGYRPLPKDIIVAARAVLGEQQMRWTDEERAQFEALCDAKAAPDAPALPAGDSRAAVTAGAGPPGSVSRPGNLSGRITAISERLSIDAPTRGAYHETAGHVQHPAIARIAEEARASAPPVPLPCPDCGSTQPCEHDEEND